MEEKTLVREETSGGVGLLIDETPLMTTANVRPYAIAILLHRGAIGSAELIASLVPHCRISDLKDGEWDPLDEEWCEGTRLEKLVDEVLGELTSEGIVRYNETLDLWVLTANDISKIISWVAALGARIPQHLLLELSRDQLTRIPDYIHLDNENC
jgi:hypothetical protein